MRRTFTSACFLAAAAVVGLSGDAVGQVGYHSPAFQRVAVGYRFGGGYPYGGLGAYRPFGYDYSFYQPFSYGYGFYRPYYGFYVQPNAYTSVYRPFYYPPGFYRPGFPYGAGFRPGYGQCGAYGYGAYGYGAGSFGY